MISPRPVALSDSQIQELLTLALLSYRGTHVPHLLGDAWVTRALERGLAKLPHVSERYRLVWGVASKSPGWRGFDDAMAYVVQDLRVASRFVVVVRGTNPFSVPDWLFGDLWTSRLIAWSHGEASPDVRISLSTQVGLSALQTLRAEPRLVGEAATVPVPAIRSGADRLLSHVGGALGGELGAHRRRVHALLGQVQIAGASGSDWANRWIARRASLPWQEIHGRIDSAIEAASNHVTFDLFCFLDGTQRHLCEQQAGENLATLLARITATVQHPEIWVTGHSKGGALAPALSLWLADTQGRSAPVEEQWDPDARARVHCVAFAGPTPGNARFAQRLSDRLDGRLHRIANRRDFVTSAWDPRALVAVPSLYVPEIDPPLSLALLAKMVAADIEPLEYATDPSRDTVFDAPVSPMIGGFLAQEVHQHLDAYMRWAELGITPTQLLGLDAAWIGETWLTRARTVGEWLHLIPPRSRADRPSSSG
jgi:hypothetical protein